MFHSKLLGFDFRLVKEIEDGIDKFLLQTSAYKDEPAVN